jgi:hypothetical protein
MLPRPKSPISPITIKYMATMKFSKRGMTRIRIPAINDIRGVRPRVIFMKATFLSDI